MLPLLLFVLISLFPSLNVAGPISTQSSTRISSSSSKLSQSTTSEATDISFEDPSSTFDYRLAELDPRYWHTFALVCNGDRQSTKNCQNSPYRYFCKANGALDNLGPSTNDYCERDCICTNMGSGTNCLTYLHSSVYCYQQAKAFGSGSMPKEADTNDDVVTLSSDEQLSEEVSSAPDEKYQRTSQPDSRAVNPDWNVECGDEIFQQYCTDPKNGFEYTCTVYGGNLRYLHYNEVCEDLCKCVNSVICISLIYAPWVECYVSKARIPENATVIASAASNGTLLIEDGLLKQLAANNVTVPSEAAIAKAAIAAGLPAAKLGREEAGGFNFTGEAVNISQHLALSTRTLSSATNTERDAPAYSMHCNVHRTYRNCSSSPFGYLCNRMGSIEWSTYNSECSQDCSCQPLRSAPCLGFECSRMAVESDRGEAEGSVTKANGPVLQRDLAPVPDHEPALAPGSEFSCFYYFDLVCDSNAIHAECFNKPYKYHCDQVGLLQSSKTSDGCAEHCRCEGQLLCPPAAEDDNGNRMLARGYGGAPSGLGTEDDTQQDLETRQRGPNVFYIPIDQNEEVNGVAESVQKDRTTYTPSPLEGDLEVSARGTGSEEVAAAAATSYTFICPPSLTLQTECKAAPHNYHCGPTGKVLSSDPTDECRVNCGCVPPPTCTDAVDQFICAKDGKVEDYTISPQVRDTTPRILPGSETLALEVESKTVATAALQYTFVCPTSFSLQNSCKASPYNYHCGPQGNRQSTKTNAECTASCGCFVVKPKCTDPADEFICAKNGDGEGGLELEGRIWLT